MKNSVRFFKKLSHNFSTLVIAEHANGKMSPVTSKMLTAATKFEQEVIIFIYFFKPQFNRLIY